MSKLIDKHKAGCPTNPSLYWIHLRPNELARLFFEEYGEKLSHSMVKRHLRQNGFKYRKAVKNLATGQYADRDIQFQIIQQMLFSVSLNTPIISMDCKKKEQIGNLYREGKCYTQGTMEVYDHDYSHLAKGKAIPHGIFDLARNEGYITIGNSHETAAFIVDNLLWWWDNFGIHHYPDAQNILILCDAGGGNSYRHHAFKKELLLLAQTIGKDILIAHYPPYSSKWNPIEHRLFAHVHKAMEGVIFTDLNIIQTLIEKTYTKEGLKVIARIVDKHYPLGIKTDKEMIEYNRILFHPNLKGLSYRILA